MTTRPSRGVFLLGVTKMTSWMSLRAPVDPRIDRGRLRPIKAYTACAMLLCLTFGVSVFGRDYASDCNDNGVPDDQDIASGTSVDDNGNGLPDECEVRKNRYLTFASASTGPAVAYRIELTASTYFPDSTGVLGWVGEPGGKNLSRVVGEPFFSDDWPPYVFIGDCQIVPVATFAIRPTPDGVSFGDATVLATIAKPDHPLPKLWGDVVGEYTGQEWTPPDGSVDFLDVVAIVHAFQAREPVPHWTRADLDGEVPNAIINMTDVLRVLYAFMGMPYPFSEPAYCP